MDTQKRKEAIAAWKNRRPNMGVFALKCEATDDTFLGVSMDTDRAMNGIRARLENGMHPNKKLQSLWSEHGDNQFSYEVIKLLEYEDADEDLSSDLEALLELVSEQMPETELL